MNEFEQFGGYEINSQKNNNTNQDEFSQFGGYAINKQVNENETQSDFGLNMAKKFGQGLAYGVGSTADTINKYIAAPVTDLAATGIKKTGELLTNVGLDGVGGAVTGLGEKTQQLSQGYANSNAADSYPKMEFLQTNNNDK